DWPENGPVEEVPRLQSLVVKVTTAPSSRLPLASSTVTTIVERLPLEPNRFISTVLGEPVAVALAELAGPMHSTSFDMPSWWLGAKSPCQSNQVVGSKVILVPPGLVQSKEIIDQPSMLISMLRTIEMQPTVAPMLQLMPNVTARSL